jgi:hypothetical protein
MRVQIFWVNLKMKRTYIFGQIRSVRVSPFILRLFLDLFPSVSLRTTFICRQDVPPNPQFRIPRYISVKLSSLLLEFGRSVVVWLARAERSDERSPSAVTFLWWWHFQLIFFIRCFNNLTIRVHYDFANLFLLAQDLMWSILLHRFDDLLYSYFSFMLKNQNGSKV